MAVSTFYQYPNGIESQGGTRGQLGSYTDVDDAWDASDGLITKYKQRTGSVSTETGWTSFGLTTPTPGVTINWIRVHYKFWREQGGGSWNGGDAGQTVVGAVRPAASATYYTSSSRTIVDTGGYLVATGSYGVNYLPWYNTNTLGWVRGTGPAHVYWEWTTNPVTALPWTISDLQALLVCWAFDASKGSPGALVSLDYGTGNNPGVCATSIFIEVNATSGAANIEEKRLNTSAFLRLFRAETEEVSVDLPLDAANVDIGGIVSMAHELGPASDGAGWGVQPWQRHYGMLLSKAVDPIGKRVKARILDLTRFHCSLWFPAITDLPYTEEGQGIPYLDAGGGLGTFSRLASNPPNAAVNAYVLRQKEDTLYAQVPTTKPSWTPNGLAVFSECYSALKNNSFSQGATDVFTDWTFWSGTGGTKASSTTDFLFDASGLRRSAVLSTTTSSGSTAELSQAVTLSGTHLRVHLLHKKTAGSTSAFLAWCLKRSGGGSDYYDDSDGTWKAGPIYNPCNVTLGQVTETYSKVIATAGVSTTYTLYIYASHSASDVHTMVYYFAELQEGNASNTLAPKRSPMVTTTAASYSGKDIFPIANPPTARSMSPTQGTAFGRVIVSYDHADISDGSDGRFIFDNYADASNWERLYTVRSGAGWLLVFQRRASGTSYNATITLSQTAAFDRELVWACRWQGTGGELGLTNYAGAVFASVGGSAVQAATATAAAPSSASRILYPGCSGGGGSQLDGWLSRIEVVPYVLDDTEIYRRMGV